MFDLERFKKAQDSDFDTAIQELRAGRKRSHWIWYIFPQIEGLGRSGTARHYAIRGVDEATAYLTDPVLRERLLAAAGVVADKLSIPLTTLMGSSTDALKLVSSMTLFGEVARRLGDLEDCAEISRLAERILAGAAEQGHQPCGFTLERLEET